MAQPETGLPLESDLIKPGLARAGIGPDWRVVTASEPSLVERTAARLLLKFLRKGGLALKTVPSSGDEGGGKRIIIGTHNGAEAIRAFADPGDIRIRDVSPLDDGFHVKRIGDDIIVAGANPRGVLYGVYELEEYIRGGAEGPLDIRAVPHFRRRSSGVGYYWNRQVTLATDEFTREKAEFLSRLRINQYCADNNGSPIGNHLHDYVSSDVFPFQNPPDPDCVRRTRALSSICAEYGIDTFLMIWEPVIPQNAGDLGRYPADAIGTVRRPWGGDENNIDHTLCVHSPAVQAHYRSLMANFVREYPDVKGLFVYNMDGSSWLCTPELCPRCGQAVKDSPPDRHNPWETQALLMRVLADAAHGARPGFEFGFWVVHYRGEAARKLIENADGCDVLLVTWNGGDSDVMIPGEPGRESPGEEFLLTRECARVKGVPFFVILDYNRRECVQQGLPFPFQVADSIRKLKRWGVPYLMDTTGPDPAHNPVNALTLKEFQSGPDRDPAEFLRGLAERQFGAEAGSHMYRAWEEIKNAMDIWNGYGHSYHPMCGSQAFLGAGLLGPLPEPVLPAIWDYYEFNLCIRTQVEPWRAPDYQRFRTKEFLGEYKDMCAHLAKAAELAAEAEEKADGREYARHCPYPGSPEGPGRPTRREYAELNAAAIRIASAVGEQKTHTIEAYHLLGEEKSRRASGDEAGARDARGRYLDLVRRDLALQRRFEDMMEGFITRRPCLSRVGMTGPDIEAMIAGTREKIARLEEFLSACK